MHSAPLSPGGLGLLVLAGLTGSARSGATDVPVDFGAQIRPLLSDRCFTCHGPGAEDPGGGLRLDLEDEAVSVDGFSAIVPGDASASELVARLTHENAKRRMPPVGSNLSLSTDEIALLRRWIDEGADYGEHWAFVRPERTPPPEVTGRGWCRDELDQHILAKLEAAGLEPAPAADPLTLLRRVSLDLTGLPPSVADVDDYLAAAADSRYEQAVDRLLSSKAHAEHRTAHWLDVARYADTFGYQSDVDTNVWPWRDWALRAFESNQPYDEFLTHQLAGDLIPNATRESRLATAFNRLHRQTNEGGSVEEEFRVEYVCDRVETMAGAFLGLTVGCARCHDHKFDPISQRDYFGLFAYFDGIDESGLYSHFTSSTPTPALGLPDVAQERDLASLQAQVDEAEAKAEGPLPWRTTFQACLGEVVDDPVDGGGTRRIVRSTEPASAVAELRGGVERAEQEGGPALRLDGENAVVFPKIGAVARSMPLSIELSLNVPEAYDRAVVIHRTKSWTDSGSRGYQLLIEDGHFVVAFVHFWPGDAIAIRSVDPVVPGRWTRVRFDYDGSSRAEGLRLFLDGEQAPITVVRDHLTRKIVGGSIEHLTIGSRFRDRGFKGGMVRDIVVRELDALASPLHTALRDRRTERDALRDQVRQIMTMREAPDLAAAERTAFVLRRGVYTERGASIEPRTPTFLPSWSGEAGRGAVPRGSRLDLARWLTHPDHPLTARVHVDRLWRHAFRSGLVATAADFGSQTREPVHRALLDTLARDLVTSGWDSRAMLRRFVLSSTYRQSSVPQGPSISADPDGELFSRAHRTRFGAETIRDALLAAAGRLVQRTGGASVLPYQPPGLWQEKSGRTYRPGRGDDLRRRSLYTFWRRTSPPPTMTMFDAPSREVCRVERPATTTPLQSLALWNDPQFVDVSLALARRAIEAGGEDDAARVEHIVMALATRPATQAESAAMVTLLGEQREVFRGSPAAALGLARYDLDAVAQGKTGAPGGDADADDIELAATAIVASTLLGLDDVVMRR